MDHIDPHNLNPIDTICEIETMHHVCDVHTHLLIGWVSQIPPHWDEECIVDFDTGNVLRPIAEFAFSHN